jgi:hypothetical protein
MLSTWTYPEDLHPLRRYRCHAQKRQGIYCIQRHETPHSFPLLGTKFLICGLRGPMPQNDTSLAALNPLIHIIDF